MMKKIVKVEYIVALLLSVGIFNSCSNGFVTLSNDKIFSGTKQNEALTRFDTISGSYLAGRVAHMRQDLDKAAKYYAKAIDLGCDNPEIVGRTYILLAFEGNVDEAFKYAMDAEAKGDQNHVIKFIKMAYYVSHGQYDQAKESLEGPKEDIYQKIILPPFNAWIAAGNNDFTTAVKALEPLNKDPQTQVVYYMHLGLIYDYFGKTDQALDAFEKVMKDDGIELSYRSLQIITDFYMRQGQKEKALEFVKTYSAKNYNPTILSCLYRVLEQNKNVSGKLVDTPQKGLAEALFNMGTIFRSHQMDVAQIFNMLALYLNPNHDVAHASVADLFELSGQSERANREYAKIDSHSPIYYMAMLKLASIQMSAKNNIKALAILKTLDKDFPDNYQILFNLGEVYRMLGEQSKAIKHYKRALVLLPEEKKSDWTILYALGMAYEQDNNRVEAENYMQKALLKSNRHPVVLNYLGYSWLKENKNPNEALYMIFEAYRQNPEDAYVMDSLGWALYKMGRYEDAVKVLERAAEYLPDQAIVCEHLGDVYWQLGRKNEAEYQWKHALNLEDDSNEVNRDDLERKLKNGMDKPFVIQFNEPLLVERLKALDVQP